MENCKKIYRPVDPKIQVDGTSQLIDLTGQHESLG